MTGRRITAFALAMACAAGLSACQTSGTGGTGGGTAPDDPATIGYEPRPVDTYIANRAPCDSTFRPLLTAYQAVTGLCDPDGLDFVRDGSRISVDYIAQGPDTWSVAVTQSNLEDDSVRSQRHRIDLDEAPDGTWTVVAAGLAWRCWPDRGHQDFRAEPCL